VPGRRGAGGYGPWLQQAAEDARKALEAEKKQVEGESFFRLSIACRFSLFGIRSQFLFFIYGF
jgi:hypothetical protein